MKILLAIDRSRFSDAATEAVVRQMRPEGTEVCVLNAVAPEPYIPEWNLMSAEQQRKEAQKFVEKAGEALRKAGFQVQTLIEDGEPRTAIVAKAKKWKADLIVVGSHGYKGLERLQLGSVAEYLARHSPCPVEIVRSPESASK